MFASLTTGHLLTSPWLKSPCPVPTSLCLTDQMLHSRVGVVDRGMTKRSPPIPSLHTCAGQVYKVRPIGLTRVPTYMTSLTRVPRYITSLTRVPTYITSLPRVPTYITSLPRVPTYITSLQRVPTYITMGSHTLQPPGTCQLPMRKINIKGSVPGSFCRRNPIIQL